MPDNPRGKIADSAAFRRFQENCSAFFERDLNQNS